VIARSGASSAAAGRHLGHPLPDLALNRTQPDIEATASTAARMLLFRALEEVERRWGLQRRALGPELSSSPGTRSEPLTEVQYIRVGVNQHPARRPSVNVLFRIARVALWIVGSVFALVLLISVLLPIINPPPKTYRYVFPAGVTKTQLTTESGFLLRTKIPGAPSLPREDGFRLVRFDQAPNIDTSDEYVFGHEWFREEVYVVDEAGHRKELTGVYCTPTPSLAHYPVKVTCDAR
jgi:hypothetical protein